MHRRAGAVFGVAILVLVLSAVRGSRAQSATTPSQTGSIAGQVVSLDTRQPLVGASVRALVLTTDGSPAPPPIQVKTDEAGRFEVTGLSAGRLSLTASADGYLPEEFHPGLQSQIPMIQSGQRLTGVVLALARAATISGLVLDDAGKPLANIEVHAYFRGILTVRRAWLDVRQSFGTDATGRYRVSNLAPGEYVVSVPVSATTTLPAVASAVRAIPRAQFETSPIVQALDASRGPLPGTGFDPSDARGVWMMNGLNKLPMAQPSSRSSPIYRTTYYPSATTLDAAGIITLHSGETREDVNITLQHAEAFRVTGILTRDGKPVPFTGVHLIAGDAAERSVDRDGLTAISATGLDGAFALESVPPGNYALKVAVLPVPPGATNPPSPPANRLTGWASESLRVVNRDVDLREVVMRPPITISGRVEFIGAETPSPAVGGRSTVWLAAVDGGMYAPPAMVTVDQDGRFVLRGAMRSRYHLWGGTYAGWYVVSVTAAGADITSNALVVGDRDIDDVVIKLSRRPTSVAGLVVNAEGAPVVGAEVLVFPAKVADWIANGLSNRVVRRTRSNTTGRFSAGGLPPGTYMVAALPGGSAFDYPDRRLFEFALTSAASAALAEGVPVDLRIVVSQKREPR